MTLERAQELLAELRAALAAIAGGAAGNADEILAVAGDLFDANYLDGSQYAALHELQLALRYNAANVRELAARCTV